MKHRISSLLLAMTLTAGLAPAARASAAPSVVVNGIDLGSQAMAAVVQDTTYVSLRAVSAALAPEAEITWEDGSAVVRTASLTLSAAPNTSYITVNGNQTSVPLGVKEQDGRVLVPVRTLAGALGAQVAWDAASWQVSVTGDSGEADALYWLSRIISAESQGEPLEGKIAVGNVILNRVAHSDFPDTVYDVIFDSRWGGQFEPVRSGTIYQDPTEESVLAAQLCLEGTVVLEDGLYFMAPALAQNFWTADSREYITTIGSHDFYR